MQEVLEELEGEEGRHDQKKLAQRGVGQGNKHAHGDELITQARSTTAYSPNMRSSGPTTGREMREEEANQQRTSRTYDGRQRRGKLPMTTKDQLRGEEERRRMETLARRGDTIVAERG
jgi:hypothetical protein